MATGVFGPTVGKASPHFLQRYLTSQLFVRQTAQAHSWRRRTGPFPPRVPCWRSTSCTAAARSANWLRFACVPRLLSTRPHPDMARRKGVGSTCHYLIPSKGGGRHAQKGRRTARLSCNYLVGKVSSRRRDPPSNDPETPHPGPGTFVLNFARRRAPHWLESRSPHLASQKLHLRRLLC